MLTSCPPNHDAIMGNRALCQSHKGPCCQHSVTEATRSGFPRRGQPGSRGKHWEWKQAGACRCFHTGEMRLQGLGCQAKQTHKQPAPAGPQHFSPAQGRKKRNELSIVPLASVQLEASAAEAFQDSTASGQGRCQTGLWWKSGEGRKRTLIC